MTFTVDTEQMDDGVYIRVGGDLDSSSAPEFTAQASEILNDKPAVVVVDLSQVSFLDSTGLGSLIRLLTDARAFNGAVELIVTHPRIQRVFDITGMAEHFTFRSTD